MRESRPQDPELELREYEDEPVYELQERRTTSRAQVPSREPRRLGPERREADFDFEEFELEDRRPAPRTPAAPREPRRFEPEPPAREYQRYREYGDREYDLDDRRASTRAPIAGRLRSQVVQEPPLPDTESMMATVTQRVDIDPHGRLVPYDDGARRVLAERAGSFNVLPSAPDLLIASRAPAAGGIGPRARCSLAGDLAVFPIADLIAFTHQSRLSGLLTVSTPGAERVLAFKEGEVRGSRSNAPGERIGEVALRMGYVDERQLEAVATAPVPIGKALVERGFISRHELWKCLHEQVAVVFHGVLIAGEGVFTMVDNPDLDLGTTLSVSTQALLMNGIRRIDEMALFRSRVPGMQSYLRRRRPSAPVELHPEETALLKVVDGRRRVEDIANLLHLDEYETTKIAYHLAGAGYLEATSEPMPEQERTAERASPEGRSIASGLNGTLRLIVREVATVRGVDSFLDGVRNFLSDIESKYAPLWRELAPARDGSIDVARLLANLARIKSVPDAYQSSGGAAAYLAEGIRELTLFYLFQAGEVVHWSTHERLQLEVKRWLQTLGERRRTARHDEARLAGE